MTNMSSTKKAKEPTSPAEDGAIDTYDKFQQAVMEIHQNIDQHDDPILEVTHELFGALAKGKKIDSMTYGDPGIRVFKVGMMNKILQEEAMPADQYRELEIKRLRGDVK